ncbi:MAG: signal recognition particle-docking protein FtsY [bacterium]|nr:signal recognition particle-docking protein FtsY [bacterium]
MSSEERRSTPPSATSGQLDLAPEAVFPAAEKKGFWKKLQRGLFMTHTELVERMDAALDGRAVVDEETLEFLEESLIACDLGVETSLELVERVKENVGPTDVKDLGRLRRILTDEIAVLLLDAPQPSPLGPGPTVTLMVGVNGVGKTTCIAKLTQFYQDQGRSVLLAAGDTFRAAAIEQIATWGERLGVGVIRQRSGADPAAVVFDALQAARARNIDHLIVDTAGRLHNKSHLMAELAKIRRLVDREAADWQRRTLLVLDATTGQNAIAQAREFMRVAEVDGVFLTKLDGTAKGGMAVAVARDLRLPVLYLGVGEGTQDMVDFRPREFAAALFG